MKLNVDFKELHKAVAPLGNFETEFRIENTKEEWESIVIDGILDTDFKLSDIYNINGLLGLNNHQVMLYIPDQDQRIEDVLADGKCDGAKRVHIAECRTIDEMRARGRFNNRYQVTNRIDGSFKVVGNEYYSGKDITGEAELAVCRNCLTLLNHHNFSVLTQAKKNQLINDFSYINLFETYSSYFRALPKSTNGYQSSGYTNDWRSISANLRKQLNYTCEHCQVNLSASSHLLHVHHINGNKSDNHRKNLRALCADCHKKQPHHGHLFVSHEDTLTINRYRREQQKFDVYNYTNVLKYSDTALHGLLEKCRASHLPIPELGLAFQINDQTVSPDLCWQSAKVAIVINPTSIDLLKNHGWTVYTPFKALDNFYQFQAKVR